MPPHIQPLCGEGKTSSKILKIGPLVEKGVFFHFKVCPDELLNILGPKIEIFGKNHVFQNFGARAGKEDIFRKFSNFGSNHTWLSLIE